jgi:hypothetical protein
MEYVLNLSGNLEEKMKKIGINNSQQLDVWVNVQRQVSSADKTMQNMGRSVGSLREKVAALRAQREWIPPENREAIRQTNHEIQDLEREIENLENLDGGKLNKWFKELGNSAPLLSALKNPLVQAALAIRKMSAYIGESRELYKAQAEAETKLAAVMYNTMGASRAEMDSILELTSAQQKLGVIGDEVQLAGAQELTTYLEKKSSLEKIIPVMNDMLAQQYGLNASQEQAVTIATMLGKVMNGQTGALSKYGYSFTKAQEKILKHGTEAQRAATLFDVVSESVGGVNEALAATPEGKLKQIANNAGDLQERVGRLATLVSAAFSPVAEKIQSVIESITTFFENNIGIIQAVVGGLATAISGLISGLEFLAAPLGLLTLGMIGYTLQVKWAIISDKIHVMWLNLKTKAAISAGNAMKFLSSTMGLIAIGLVAVYALYRITAKIIAQQNKFKQLTGDVAAQIGVEQRELNGLFDALEKTNPKSEERKKLLEEMKEKYPDFLDYQSLEKANEEELETARRKANDELARSIVLQKLKDTQSAGMEAIAAKQQEVWSKVIAKGASEDSVNAAMDKVTSIVQQKIDSGEFKSGIFSGASNSQIQDIMNEAFNGRHVGNGAYRYDEIANGSANAWRDLIDVMLENQQSVHLLADFAKGRFGVSDADILGTNGALRGAVGGKPKPAPTSTKTTNDATATGGTRSTTVNIKIDKGIGDLYFNGTTKENAPEIERNLAEMLYRVLGIASTATS